ncbi:MAG: TonB-dependent receptor [Blastocatellia bacterium]|nr:TonB-dependent receptor [Blastocatellia bacterium]MDW8257068.1 TonB-dependent receptor [Acidobacteriota bacterium]
MKGLGPIAFILGMLISTIPTMAQEVRSSNARGQGSQGTILGVVIDLQTNRPLPEVLVRVAGLSVEVRTDAEGNFRLLLPPGTYELRIWRDGYREEVVPAVEVRAGDVTSIDIALSPADLKLGEIEVRAGDGDARLALLEERKAAAVVSDAISAAEMVRDVKSDTASVLSRLVGLSVVQNKYVYVRGLGERYSQTMLGEAMLPTTEPDRRVVPMDLIPANLLQEVRVLKSFTPDQPGEFSGGVVKLRTLDFPPSGTLKIGYSIGGNSQTSFKPFGTYPGGRWDWLGFGQSTRRLPAIIPDQAVIPGRFSSTELQAFGRAFRNIWEPRHHRAAPNQGINLSGGGSWGRWGIVGGLSFSNTLHTQREDRIFYILGAERRPIPRSIFADSEFLRRHGLLSRVREVMPEGLDLNLLQGYTSSTQTARLGGLTSVAYQLTSQHKLMFRSFYAHDGTDQTRIYQGWYESRFTVIRNYRLRFTEEEIASGQLAGEHVFPSLGNSLLAWRWTYSRARLDEPDAREVIYEFDPGRQRFRFFSQLQSGLRLFNRMRENLREPAVDWSTFFFARGFTLALKAGASYSNRDRAFLSRRFRFIARRLRGIDVFLPPEQLLAPENIRPDGFELFEETRPTDAYAATHDIAAGYVMGDLTFKRWRLILGGRVEDSDQLVQTFNPFNRTLNPVEAGQKIRDVLPSMGLVLALTPQMNVRLGWSQTVARPHFRELSPYEYTDVTGGPSARGNPDLRRTRIRNFDLRWEWIRPPEVFAVSFFLKRMTDPIEPVIEPSNETTIVSFRNVAGARNAGFEVEVRRGLGFLGPSWQRVGVLGNYTYVRSRVTIGRQQLNVLTSLRRPLVGQSQHLFNAALDYEIPRISAYARLLAQYVGQRLSEVGAYGLADIVQDGYPTLDFIFAKQFLGEAKRMEIKVSLENLLNRTIRFHQGSDPYWFYRRGRTIQIGLSYRIR